MPSPVIWLAVGMGVVFLLLIIFGRGTKGKR